MADAEIKFNTSIDQRGFEAGVDDLRDGTDGLKKAIALLGMTMDKAFNPNGTEEATAAIMKQQGVVDGLKQKLQTIADIKAKTTLADSLRVQLDEASREIDRYGSEISNLQQHMNKIDAGEELFNKATKQLAMYTIALAKANEELDKLSEVGGLAESVEVYERLKDEAFSYTQAIGNIRYRLKELEEDPGEYGGEKWIALTGQISEYERKLGDVEGRLTEFEGKAEERGINFEIWDKAKEKIEGFEMKLSEAQREQAKFFSAVSAEGADAFNEMLDKQEELIKASDEVAEKYSFLEQQLAQIEIPEQPKEAAEELVKKLEVEAQKIIELQEKAIASEERRTQQAEKSALQIEAAQQRVTAAREKAEQQAEKSALQTQQSEEMHAARIVVVNQRLEDMRRKYEQAGAAGKKETSALSSGMDDLGKSVERTANRIKNLVVGAFVFNVLRSAIKQFKDYVFAAAKENEAFAKSFNQFKANTYALIQPILNLLIPALTKVSSVLAYISGVILQIVATITNTNVQQLYAQARARDLETKKNQAAYQKEQEAYNKRVAKAAEQRAKEEEREAARVAKELERQEKAQAVNAAKHAKAVEKQAAEQQKYLDKLKKSNKELKKTTASFDDLITLQSESADELDSMKVFDEIPFEELKFDDIVSNIKDAVIEGFEQGFQGGIFDNMLNLSPISFSLDEIIEKAKELAGYFKEGFNIGFGNTNFDAIKGHIAGIGKSLKEIFTDPLVVDAGNRFAQTFMTSLGRIAGSVASIGATIAENIFGGLDKYFAQSKDRIKQHMINIFDLSGALSKKVADLWDVFADIFSVFRSDGAKQITADLIGIFAEARAGVTEVVLTIANDAVAFILRPFQENKGKIKSVIESTFEPIHTVLDTTKRAIQDTFDSFLRVWDERVSPALEKISKGFSELFGNLLDKYEKYIAPMVNRITDGIKNLYDDHIKPFVDEVMEYVGALAEWIAVVFDRWVKPAFKWIQDTIIPIIVPIFEYLWNTVKNVFGFIIDIVKSVIKFFRGLTDFLTGIFTGDFEKAMSGIKTMIQAPFDAIKGFIDLMKNQFMDFLQFFGDFFGGLFDAIAATIDRIRERIHSIWETIKSFFGNGADFIKGIFGYIGESWSSFWDGLKDKGKAAINSVIILINGMLNRLGSGLNAVIDAMNKLQFELPDWLGGGTFGINIKPVTIPQLPLLARGAVLPGGDPFMAVVNDQPRGQTNIEAPLATIEEALENVFARHADELGGSAPVVARIEGSAAGFFRYLNIQLQRDNEMATAFAQ